MCNTRQQNFCNDAVFFDRKSFHRWEIRPINVFYEMTPGKPRRLLSQIIDPVASSEMKLEYCGPIRYSAAKKYFSTSESGLDQPLDCCSEYSAPYVFLKVRRINR